MSHNTVIGSNSVAAGRKRTPGTLVMLKALIWKEMGGQWLWALLGLLTLGAMVYSRSSYTFLTATPGMTDYNLTPWFLPPLIFMIIMGATALAPEHGVYIGRFFFSRPTRWRDLLAAKLIAGVMIATVLTLAAAVVFVITCPALYRPFLNLDWVAHGAVVVWLFLLGGWLFGLVFSAGPGAGIYGLLQTYSLMMFWLWISDPLCQALGVSRVLSDDIMWGFFFGPLFAFQYLLRNRLTWGEAQRMGVYFGCTLGAAVICGLGGAGIRQMNTNPPTVVWKLIGRYFHPNHATTSGWSIGPEGKFAVLPARRNERWLVRLPVPQGNKTPPAILRLRNRSEFQDQGILWISPTRCFYLQQYFPHHFSVIIADAAPARQFEVPLPAPPESRTYESCCIPSPNRRFACVYSPDNDTPGRQIFSGDMNGEPRATPGARFAFYSRANGDSLHTQAVIVDLQAAKIVGPRLRALKDLWWQDDQTLAYVQAGRTRYLRLGTGARS